MNQMRAETTVLKTLYYKGVYVLAFVVQRHHQRLRTISTRRFLRRFREKWRRNSSQKKSANSDWLKIWRSSGARRKVEVNPTFRRELDDRSSNIFSIAHVSSRTVLTIVPKIV